MQLKFNSSKLLVVKIILLLLQLMENCINKVFKNYSVTWGNPDSGKLGHSGGLVKGTKTKGYGPRSYADYNAMDFVHGQLSNKTIK